MKSQLIHREMALHFMVSALLRRLTPNERLENNFAQRIPVLKQILS
jgi:hypothetical protein